MLDQKQFSLALKQICDEKGISAEQVIETIESALAAAYRKDYGHKMQNIKVKFNPETGETKIYEIKTVVEDIDPESGEEKKLGKGEITLSEAKKIKKDIQVGEEIVEPLEAPAGYGRMAAQTAKQVIIQKLREAERNTIYEEMKEKEHTVVNGVIQRYDRRGVSVTIGRASAFLPPEYQIRNEMYRPGAQLKFYIVSVEKTPRGPEIILSRRSEEILRELFSLEIPEIANGTVEIKAIAREAGERSKVAVKSNDEAIDPIGSCIGQKGSRIQTIINELNGEKIDVIEYADDPDQYIRHALSPAKIAFLELNEKEKEAFIKVAPDQFSLAIGKGGQNVRLAAKLTGWKIDIQELKEATEENQETTDKEKEEIKKEEDVGQEIENKEENSSKKEDNKEKELSA